MSSAHRMLRSSEKTVVLAVNSPPPDITQLGMFLDTAGDFISGVKIGLPYILRYGLKSVGNLISRHRGSYYFIADLKLADIDEVMVAAVNEVFDAGFNGVVAHAFVGYRGALEPVSVRVKDLGMDLFLQVSLPHEGSGEVLDPSYPLVRNVLNVTSASGLVVPASKRLIISDLRNLFGRKYVILASGILRMGARPGEGLCAGADAEIIGRAITLAVNPGKAVKEIVSSQREYLESRRAECVQR